MKKIYWLFFLAVLLSGCATVDSNISVYHRGDIRLKGETYAFMPIKKLGQNNDLQYDYFTKVISTHLSNYGMREVPLKKAHLIVRFTYGSYDTYGPYLEYTAYTSTQALAGFGNTAYKFTRQGNMTYTELSSDTLFPYAFVMLIYKSSDIGKALHKPIYQVIAGSSAETANTNKMLSYLIETVFKDFPGKSGTQSAEKE